MTLITNPKDVFFLTKGLHHRKKESLAIFYLNHKGLILEKKEIKAKNKEIRFNQAEIFTPTLKNKAQFIVLAHNHPSGKLAPSQSDLATTKILLKAGKILSITIIDHVIVTPNGFYSILQKTKVFLPADH